MDKVSFFDHQARAAEGRREALSWLSRRLKWEHRLGELRPHDANDEQAAKAA